MKNKTYAQDFFENYPNAPKRETGIPHACRANMYEQHGLCYHVGSCEHCWNAEMQNTQENS